MLAPADSEHQNAASSPGNQNSDRPPQSDLAKIHPVLPANNALILYNASSFERADHLANDPAVVNSPLLMRPSIP
jgi:hypothetical protein